MNPSKFFIRNCEFKFKCSQQWEDLDSGGDGVVTRQCPQCQKTVHMVQNAWELVIAIEKNYCVAVPRIESLTAKAVLNKDKPLLGHVGFKRL